jgi:hypothetical protein
VDQPDPVFCAVSGHFRVVDHILRVP